MATRTSRVTEHVCLCLSLQAASALIQQHPTQPCYSRNGRHSPPRRSIPTFQTSQVSEWSQRPVSSGSSPKQAAVPEFGNTHARPVGREGRFVWRIRMRAPRSAAEKRRGRAGTRQGNQGIVHVGNRPPEGEGLRLRHGERDYAGLTPYSRWRRGRRQYPKPVSLSPCLLPDYYLAALLATPSFRVRNPAGSKLAPHPWHAIPWSGGHQGISRPHKKPGP